MTVQRRPHAKARVRQVVNVEMPVELYEALGKQAQEEERSMSSVVRLALRIYIEERNGS